MRVLYYFALLLLLVPAACASVAPEGEEATADDPASEESPPPEVRVEVLGSGDSGLEEPQVLVATSADELSGASGVEVPDQGNGLYVAAHAGERPTDGHSVELEAAGSDGGRAELRIPVSRPDGISTQALTYPYAIALVRPALPDGSVSFVDGDGEELGWPGRRLSG